MLIASKELGIILLSQTSICITLLTTNVNISSQRSFLKIFSCDSDKKYRSIFSEYPTSCKLEAVKQ